MKAMILAAGKGTRMQPLTNTLPKPMIPLLGKPIMESIIAHLKDYGVDEIVVNTSHLAHVLEDYFHDGERFGIQIAYSFEGVKIGDKVQGQPLGSAGGMKHIQDFSRFFDETFIVLCGDALVDLDIAEAVRFHKERKSLATIVMKEVHREEVCKYGVVKTDESGRILQFQEKPRVEEAISNTVNSGFYIFEPEIFEHIPSGIEYDIGGQLFPALAEAGLPFYGITLPFQWVDISSLPDYWAASRLVLNGQVKGYQMPGKEIRKGVYCGINLNINFDKIDIVPPVFIGSSTSIGDGVRIIGPAIIGPNCIIESGAVIDNSLVHDYTRVSSVARLENHVVFGNHCIDHSGQIVDLDATHLGWIVDDARRQVHLSKDQQLLYDTARDLK